MKIIYYKPHVCYLLDDAGQLIINVRSNRGFVDFSITYPLDDTETAKYHEEGNVYIDQLASDIDEYQDAFLGLEVDLETHKRVHTAIMAIR